MTIPVNIFISYRRSDAGGHARSLFNQLRLWFSSDALFFDLDGIDMGDTFPAAIQSKLDQAGVVLAVIGPDWLAEINHRAGNAKVDYVRREVAAALARPAPLVVPVFMGEATPFDADRLDPALRGELAPLCDLNAHAFQGRQADWDNQFVQLRHKIATVPGIPAPRFRPPEGTPRPWRIIGHQLSAHFQDPNDLLDRIHAQLSTSGNAALVARAALHGMGGLGKTQLALKYSLDYRDHYAGVWWFGAETETTLQLDAQAACEQVGAPIIQGQTPAASFRHWLERQDAPWLLVFDNAENAEALHPYLPQGGPHRILITSRNPAWNSIATALELEVWSAAQGAAFFAARLPQRAAENWEALTRELDGLPLALEQAASYLENTGIDATAYRGLLADEKKSAALLDKGHPASGYEYSVIATLTLAATRLSEPARQLLRLLAFAAPEPLPERFLREAAEKLPPELAALAGDELAWNDLIAELRAYALAERGEIPALDREPGETAIHSEPALTLHRLTQQALRARLAQPEEDCPRFQAVLRRCCPADTNLPRHWPRLAALAPHVTGLERYLDAGWLHRRQFSGLLDRVASYLKDGPALYGDATQWHWRALEITREELGEEHPDTLVLIGNLALTLHGQGDLAGALELEELVLATWRRVLGEEHPITLTAMNNLALTLHALGDLAGAFDLEKSALATRRHALGDEHPDTLISMSNLALTLHAQGDLAGALNLGTSALAIRHRVLGEEHPDTLTSMSNLASILRAQGDLAGALELQKSALTARRRMLGAEHPDTLTAMDNLAGTLKDQGNLAGALDLEKSALAALCRVLGAEHPDTLGSAWNQFTTVFQLDDRVAAQELLRTHLIPLLARDPANLGADLQSIRRQLLDNRDAIEQRTGLAFPDTAP